MVLKKLLKEVIISIKSWDDSLTNMFYVVNNSWKGDKVVFNFISTHSDTVRMLEDGLIPYLLDEYGNEVLDLFHPRCVPLEERLDLGKYASYYI